MSRKEEIKNRIREIAAEIEAIEEHDWSEELQAQVDALVDEREELTVEYFDGRRPVSFVEAFVRARVPENRVTWFQVYEELGV